MPKVKIPNKLCRVIFPNSDVTRLTTEQEAVIAKAAKNMIVDAVKSGINLGVIKDEYESEFAFHYNLTFPQDVDRPIKFLSQKEKEVPSRTCLKLLIAAIDKGYHTQHIPSDSNGLTSYLSTLGFTARHHQNLLFDYIRSAMSNGKCGIVEGGTGIGKTLAILANANELAKHHEQRAVIATNTVSNINQYIKTYNDLIYAGYQMQPMQMVLGQRSFVSVNRLKEILEDGHYNQYESSVLDWLKNGGRNIDEDPILPSYQITSIEKICPDIPAIEISLRSYDKDDIGMKAYADQFNLDDEPSAIILCTHAMLCVDAKRRVFSRKSDDIKLMANELNSGIKSLVSSRESLSSKSDIQKVNKEIRESIQKKDAILGDKLKDSNVGILPQYHFLIVDEAHLLESAMSDALSSKLSFRSVVRGVKELADKGRVAQSVYVKVNAVMGEVLRLYDSNQTQIKVTGEFSGLKDALGRFCSIILNAKGIKYCDEPWVDEIRKLQNHVRDAGVSYLHLIISFSPVRHYPQAIMGSVNTSQFLSTLWNQTTSSCCISATLYFKKYLEFSASHFIDVLNIPEHKCMTFDPINPMWLKEPVETFYIPPVGNEDFIPVDSSEKDPDTIAFKLSKWQETIAEKIIEIHESAAGGVLVLMTSFADTLAVADLIMASGAVDALVYADGEHTLAKQKEKFISLTKDGKKPIWLGLGGAWTGLDINGTHIGLSGNEISAKDNVITDLVIPKIPFGLNMTLAHMIRKRTRNNKSKLEILDTAIRFKQGIGRLVRLEGQPKNRRIFMLDGRIHDSRKKGFYTPIIQYIETYPSVECLK